MTHAYCRAAAAALGLTIRFQWKHGGIERGMLRCDEPTAGMSFEDGQGRVIRLEPSGRCKRSTRRMFPQVSADLRVRWCSAYVKIDIARRAINNDPRFQQAKILFVTGERRQESAARARYAETEEHLCTTGKRRVDGWRPVIDWSEHEVWDALRQWRIRPHPAYELGWGRVSCMSCIFGDRDQWAAVRALAPERFERIAADERQFGKTIHRSQSVGQQADKGRSFVDDAPEPLKRQALGRTYSASDFFLPLGQLWLHPPGAFKRCGGPT